MFVAKRIRTDHADIINDVTFDYHGTRMATCSSDQTVKVWDEGDDGNWICTASWKTHSRSVWKVTWAHPEFGQVLATCSFDRTAAIWEELVSSTAGKSGAATNTWLNRASLVDSRTFVTDIQFAPKHLGLQLATCSADGIVRIYEAVDLMNLSNWQCQHEIPVTINNAPVSLSCLSWASSRLDPPTIVVGSDDHSHPTHPKVFFYSYNDAARKWDLVESLSKVTDPVNDVQFAPRLGRSVNMVAVASKDLNIFSLKEIGDDLDGNMKHPVKFEVRHVGVFDDHKSLVWRVSWSITGTRLASSGDDGCVRLWKANYLGQWKCFQVIKASSMSQMECASTVTANLNSSTGLLP